MEEPPLLGRWTKRTDVFEVGARRRRQAIRLGRALVEFVHANLAGRL